jgi:hypothetical protein
LNIPSDLRFLTKASRDLFSVAAEGEANTAVLSRLYPTTVRENRFPSSPNLAFRVSRDLSDDPSFGSSTGAI